MIFANSKHYSVLGRSGLRGIISVLLLALFGCTIPPTVESYRDPDLDYSVYKTFSFISNNPANKDQSRSGWSLEEKVFFPIIRADMERRGLSYSPKGEESDFIVNAMIVNRYKTEYVPQKTYYATSDTYLFRRDSDDDNLFILPIRQPITYGGHTQEYFQIYAELNFFDSKTNKKIWKGSGIYNAETYDINVAAPPLISAVLERFRKLPKEKE